MKNNFDSILDIELELDININTVEVSIETLSKLAKGSIIDLKIQSGTLAQVLLNNKKIADAEILVTNKNLGITINNFTDPNSILGGKFDEK